MVTGSAVGQSYLIDEDFEGGTFPPAGWQTSGAEWSTDTSYSPTHSVEFIAANASITTPLLSSPRKLDFYAWYTGSPTSPSIVPPPVFGGSRILPELTSGPMGISPWQSK